MNWIWRKGNGTLKVHKAFCCTCTSDLFKAFSLDAEQVHTLESVFISCTSPFIQSFYLWLYNYQITIIMHSSVTLLCALFVMLGKGCYNESYLWIDSFVIFLKVLYSVNHHWEQPTLYKSVYNVYTRFILGSSIASNILGESLE